jgi:predicted ferric reductase
MGRSVSYRAGQFTWLKIGSTKPLYENPFSFASFGLDHSRIAFLIKDIGDFTHAVSELKSGEIVYLNGSFGNFGKNFHGNEPLVLIAGGVGIAPIRSILQSFAEKNIGRSIYLIYGNRVAERAINIQQDSLLTHCKDLRVFQILTEPHAGWSGLTGVIDRESLTRCLPQEILGNANVSYLVCGPALMIDATEAALAELGVSLSQIESERFQYDFTSTTKRNFLSIASWLIGTVILTYGAVIFSTR